jgi:hypothetical protein
VSELEGLLAAQRAREYRSGMDVATAGGQLGMVQQRNRMLEEQVRQQGLPAELLQNCALSSTMVKPVTACR